MKNIEKKTMASEISPATFPKQRKSWFTQLSNSNSFGRVYTYSRTGALLLERNRAQL